MEENCTPSGSPVLSNRVSASMDKPEMYTPPIVADKVSNGSSELPDNKLSDKNDLGSKILAKNLENGAMFKEKKIKKKMNWTIRARDQSSASDSDDGGKFGCWRKEFTF